MQKNCLTYFVFKLKSFIRKDFSFLPHFRGKVAEVETSIHQQRSAAGRRDDETQNFNLHGEPRAESTRVSSQDAE